MAIKHMDYLGILDRWAAVGKVTAVEFEAARAAGIVETFSKVTGMVLPPAETIRNGSPSMTLAAALAT